MNRVLLNASSSHELNISVEMGRNWNITTNSLLGIIIQEFINSDDFAFGLQAICSLSLLIISSVSLLLSIMSENRIIDDFRGDYGFLSNFHTFAPLSIRALLTLMPKLHSRLRSAPPKRQRSSTPPPRTLLWQSAWARRNPVSPPIGMRSAMTS